MTVKDSNHKLARHGEESGPHWRSVGVGWCIKCSGHARCRLGPRLMNRCRPERKDTNRYGHFLKIIIELEEGRVPDRFAKLMEGGSGKRSVTRTECKRDSGRNLKLEVSWRQKVCGALYKHRMLEDRGALPEEEGSENTGHARRRLSP